VTHYQHGGEAYKAFARYGLPPKQVIDFSVNLSPLGLPLGLKTAWAKLINSLAQYPDPEGAGLFEYYNTLYRLSETNLLPLNGSIEGIYLLPVHLGLKRVLIAQPGFYDYEAACKLAGAEIKPWRLDLANQFSFAGLEKELEGVDAVILGSPHNPTGQSLKPTQILKLCSTYPHINFIIDQAFINLSCDPKSLSLLGPECLRPNLWVLHSLTKEWALPGLRLGALVGPDSEIRALKAKLPPWRLSGPALAAIPYLLGDTDYLKQVYSTLKQERSRLFSELASNPKLTLIPTDANFFLACYNPQEGLDPLLKSALEAGLMLRDGRNFKGLEGAWFRFAILAPAQNDRLLEFLK